MNIDFGGLIIGLAIILVSMIMHELAHGLMAYWLGDKTAKDEGRLTLNPIKHLDPIMSLIVPMLLYVIGAPVLGGAKPVPINTRNLKWNEWGMALVAIAGPLMNFILAFICFLIYVWSNGEWGFMLTAMSINLSLMIFNLIPIPPLDGSRVLYAISPDGVRSILNTLEGYGFVVVYLFIIIINYVVPGGSFISSAVNGIYRFFLMLVGI